MLHSELPTLVISAGVTFGISELLGGSSFKENLRFSCIKTEKKCGQVSCGETYVWHPASETPKVNKQKNSTKTNKKNPKPNKPQMCYLLIICDFQTLFPWGNQLTDFLLTKGDFTGEQIQFSSPKPGSHTSEFLYCVCKAHGQKPQDRNGPVPSTCSKGGASCFL